MNKIFMTGVLTIILLTCFLEVFSQPNTILLIVDEYDKNKSNVNRKCWTGSKEYGFGVRFDNPSILFRVMKIYVYGAWGYFGDKDAVGNRIFTVEIRDQDLNLLKSYSFKYKDYFNSFYDSILISKIPADAPCIWATISVDITISSKEFYVIVHPNGEKIPVWNKWNSLWIGTDHVGDMYPSKSSSYIFKNGKIEEKTRFNFLIRVRWIIIPVYSVKVYTEKLPNNLAVFVKNGTSRFKLRCNEEKIIKVCKDTELFLENAIVYGNGVRY